MMAGPCAWLSPAGLVLQLLRRLEMENARLEAALEWRRRELIFWQWMVRRHPPPPACPFPPHPSPPIPPLPSPALPCPALATAALGLGGSSHSPGEKRGLRDAPSPNPEAGFSPGPWVSSVGLFQTSSVPSPPFPAPEETQTPQGVSAFWKFGLCASLVSRPPGVRVGPAPSVTSGW